MLGVSPKEITRDPAMAPASPFTMKEIVYGDIEVKQQMPTSIIVFHPFDTAPGQDAILSFGINGSAGTSYELFLYGTYTKIDEM